MSETTMIAVAAIVGFFAIFSVVLAWADRRTRNLDPRPGPDHRPL